MIAAPPIFIYAQFRGEIIVWKDFHQDVLETEDLEEQAMLQSQTQKMNLMQFAIYFRCFLKTNLIRLL